MENIARVRFLGRFKVDIGASYIDIPLDRRISIKLLLKELREKFRALSSVISEDGAPSYDVMVLVNGIDINVFDNIDELYIDEDDEVLLVPITHGGLA